MPVPTRLGPGSHRALRLTWDSGSPRYDVRVPRGVTGRSAGLLRLDVAGLRDEETRLTVEVTDTAGNRARVPITVPRPIAGRYLIADWMQPLPPTEPVPKTRTVSLAEVAAATPGFDPTRPAAVSLIPEPGSAGDVLIDNVVLTEG